MGGTQQLERTVCPDARAGSVGPPRPPPNAPGSYDLLPPHPFHPVLCNRSFSPSRSIYAERGPLAFPHRHRPLLDIQRDPTCLSPDMPVLSGLGARVGLTVAPGTSGSGRTFSRPVARNLGAPPPVDRAVAVDRSSLQPFSWKISLYPDDSPLPYASTAKIRVLGGTEARFREPSLAGARDPSATRPSIGSFLSHRNLTVAPRRPRYARTATPTQAVPGGGLIVSACPRASLTPPCPPRAAHGRIDGLFGP